MSDPQRLLAGGGTDFEREVLATWETRQPSTEVRARVLAVAGLGVAAGLMTATTAGNVGSAAGASVAPKAMIASATLFKWLAIGVLGATVAGESVAYSLRTRSDQVDPPKPPQTVVAQSAPKAAPTDNVRTDSPTETRAAEGASASGVLPASPVETAGAAGPRAQTARPPRGQSASTLDEEVSAVDRARRAIASGDAAVALAIVEAYDAKYPNGTLAQESTEIRVEALLRQGDRAGAERLAAHFIATHPSSPYVRRIRGLLANAQSR